MIWNKLAGKYDTLWVQKYSLGPTRKAVLEILNEICTNINPNIDHDTKFDIGIDCGLNSATGINHDKKSCYDEVIKSKDEKISIIDIGCGTGQLLDNISNQNIYCELTGIDKSKEMIRHAKAKNIKADLICMDILSDDYSDTVTKMTQNKYDIAICCHSFPYYPDKPFAMSKIYSIIKDGGYAIFVQASINNIYDKFVMSVIEKTAEKADYLSGEEFMKLLSGKFEVKSRFNIREKIFMPSICGFVLRKI